MKINVLELVGDHGGMNIYDKNLCNVLAELGYKTNLLTCSLYISDINEVKFKIYKLFNGIYDKFIVKRFLSYILGLIKLIIVCISSGQSIGWIHIYTFSKIEYINLVIMRLFNKKIIATIHDISSFTSYGKNREQGYSLLNVLVSEFVVHNEFSRNLLEKYTNKRIHIINDLSYEYNDFGDDNRESARQKIGLEENIKLVSFIGQIKKVKGVDVLIKSFSEVINRFPNVKLLIAGKFWKEDRQKYFDLIEDLKIEKNVILIEGYIPQEHYHLYFIASDIIILPYKLIYNSAVVVQALGYGSTTICSDLPPFIELQGKAGKDKIFETFKVNDLFDLADKIVKLLEDEREGEILKKNGKVFIERDFSFDNYKSLIGNIFK